MSNDKRKYEDIVQFEHQVFNKFLGNPGDCVIEKHVRTKLKSYVVEHTFSPDVMVGTDSKKDLDRLAIGIGKRNEAIIRQKLYGEIVDNWAELREMLIGELSHSTEAEIEVKIGSFDNLLGEKITGRS